VAAHVQDSRNNRFIDRYRAGIAIAEVLAGAIIALYVEHMCGWLLGHSNNPATGIAIFGVFLGFAAIIVACFVLLAARINAFTSMMDDVVETRRHVERGFMHASAIRAYRRISSSRSA
jgi:hypothetical protein